MTAKFNIAISFKVPSCPSDHIDIWKIYHILHFFFSFIYKLHEFVPVILVFLLNHEHDSAEKTNSTLDIFSIFSMISFKMIYIPPNVDFSFVKPNCCGEICKFLSIQFIIYIWQFIRLFFINKLPFNNESYTFYTRCVKNLLVTSINLS